jgi:hypothetical protein
MMKSSEIMTAQTTTTKVCWREKCKWEGKSTYVTIDNFPLWKKNLMIICKHPNKRGEG